MIAAMPLPPAAEKVRLALWPGPLTLVVRAAESWPWTGPDGTVGVRVPSSAVARGLAGALGAPLPATSANRSGQPGPGPADAGDVLRELGGNALDIVLDGGPLPCSLGSTVVSFTADGSWTVLREGDIPETQLAAVLDQRTGDG